MSQITPIQQSNPYKFYAYRNAAWTPGSTGANLVPLDTKLYDTNNNFSTSTFLYTVPVTGFYQFSWRASTGANIRQFGSIYKNGTEFVRGIDNAASAAGSSTFGTVTVPLTAGDTIGFYSYFASTTPIEVGSALAYMEGKLLWKT